MEILVIHVKDEEAKKNVISLLSKMKNVEIVEPSYTAFEKGTYKEGEKITDFFQPKKNTDAQEILKEAKELRKKAWRL